MDGYEATEKIRALPDGEAVKIVAVTASVIDDPQQVIQDTGVDGVVLKPFRDQEIFEVMARELGVEYVYRDRLAAPAQPAEIELSAEMLADLPPELLQELNQTTLVADREATLAVIERIEEDAPETAATLRALVQNFQMGRVRKLLKEIETEDDS
jgi:CheY-like chemotaxis protein